MRNRLALLTAFALAMSAATAGRAESPIAEIICAPRDQMVQRLTVQYRATLASTGLRDPDTVMEVWADADGRWTLVQRSANGTSCILAMGAEWATIGGAG